MPRRLPILLVSLAFLLAVAAPASHAANGDASAAAIPAEEVEQVDASLRRIEAALRDEGELGSERLRAYLSDISGARALASRCIEQDQSRLESVESSLETIGEAAPGEPPGVQEQRHSLERQRAQIEQQLQLCRVVLLRANDLQDRITAIERQRLAQRLLERGPPAWEIAAENLSDPAQWWNTAKLFLLRDSGLDTLSWAEAVGLLGLILVCAGGSLYARQPMFAMAERLPGGPTITAGFVRALLACAANVLPALVTTVVVSLYLTLIRLDDPGLAFITLLSYGLAGYFLFVFLVGLFLAPCPPAQSYLPLPEDVLRPLARRLRSLAVLILIVSLVSATLVVEGFPGPVQRLLRLVFATVLIVDLAGIIWLAGALLRWHDTRLPRVVLVAAMAAALMAEWLGFHNLAEYITAGVVGTLLAFGLAWFVWRLFDDLYDGLDEGRRRWHRRVREALGVSAERYMPGLTWLRVLTAVVVWGGFVLVVLLIWGLSDTGLAFIVRTLNDGFPIGRFEIVPIKLLWGLVALVVLIGVTGWFKQRLGQRWLTRTRMERGAREAVVTVTGYVGVGIAIFVGLAIAGVQFTNIAIIAGALSVGIGFGLQNIFNNFVSGLILLFERPIKTDDWIVVGTTEGLVKKISIRSTQIQTFDRADVIVPNSEIIQGQVINWMLRDPFGRVIVPIRVSFDADPEQVRDVLLEIGNEHPRVIKDAVLAPPPQVLLRGFGDSGFDFELRVFLTDIDYFVNVQSDLNFAIEREFRRHGIVIPYPRQDIRLERTRDPWDKGAGPRRAPHAPDEGGAPGETDVGQGGDGDA